MSLVARAAPPPGAGCGVCTSWLPGGSLGWAEFGSQQVWGQRPQEKQPRPMPLGGASTGRKGGQGLIFGLKEPGRGEPPWARGPCPECSSSRLVVGAGWGRAWGHGYRRG